MNNVNPVEVLSATGMSKDQYIDMISTRINKLSSGVDELLKERQKLNEVFVNINSLNLDTTSQAEMFRILSEKSDDIDKRYAEQITHLSVIVGMIDEVQSVYGENIALANIRDFYVNNIL